MADIYTQNWAAGNSTFSSQNVYETVAYGGTDPTDPLYPEIKAAESVHVTGAGLDWNGTYGDYQSSGIAIMPTGFNGTNGCIRTVWTPNATSLPNTYYDIITEITSGTLHDTEILTVAINGPTPPLEINLRSGGWGGPSNWQEVSIPYNFVAGTAYTFQLTWQCGTVVGDFTNVLNDGWVRLHVNGVLIQEFLNHPVWIDYRNNNFVKHVWHGFYGMFGVLSSIVYNDSGCTIIAAIAPGPGLPQPPDDPCCCCTDPGSALIPRDWSIIQPPVTYPCIGGGLYLTSADPVLSEDWSNG